MLNKKGYSLVELGIVIVIIAAVMAIIGMNGYNLYQNSKDTVVTTDLKALTDATQLYMVDTNGVTPCFTNELIEGSTATSGTICDGMGYDYVQGTDGNVDFDETANEYFTFDNILAPGYIQNVPNPQRAGQNYFYTTGDASTLAGATAFAYTGKLGGTKAERILDDNISILNAVDPSIEEANMPGCTTAEVNFTGGTALTDEASGTGVNTTIRPYTYHGFAAVKGTDTTAMVNPSDATNGCDLYSKGSNVIGGNFTNDLSTDPAATITVNARG